MFSVGSVIMAGPSATCHRKYHCKLQLCTALCGTMGMLRVEAAAEYRVFGGMKVYGCRRNKESRLLTPMAARSNVQQSAINLFAKAVRALRAGTPGWSRMIPGAAPCYKKRNALAAAGRLALNDSGNNFYVPCPVDERAFLASDGTRQQGESVLWDLEKAGCFFSKKRLKLARFLLKANMCMMLSRVECSAFSVFAMWDDFDTATHYVEVVKCSCFRDTKVSVGNGKFVTKATAPQISQFCSRGSVTPLRFKTLGERNQEPHVDEHDHEAIKRIFKVLRDDFGFSTIVCDGLQPRDGSAVVDGTVENGVLKVAIPSGVSGIVLTGPTRPGFTVQFGVPDGGSSQLL